MRLFVYGTLREGQMRSSVLSRSKYLGQIKTKPQYTMISLVAFPGLIDNGETAVVGDLYEVDKMTLTHTDMIEGHPNFYVRSKVELEDGTIAHAYFLPEDEYGMRPMIKSGDWLDVEQ